MKQEPSQTETARDRLINSVRNGQATFMTVRRSDLALVLGIKL